MNCKIKKNQCRIFYSKDLGQVCFHMFVKVSMRPGIDLSSVEKLRHGKTGNKKQATCLATLLQKELNSDVARFTTHIIPLVPETFLARFPVSVKSL